MYNLTYYEIIDKESLLKRGYFNVFKVSIDSKLCLSLVNTKAYYRISRKIPTIYK